MKRVRQPYPEEFRREAVKLVTEQGLSRSQVARDLGVDPETIRRWVRAHIIPTVPDNDGAGTTADIARLRRENEQLRMERDILKKALGIFSRMPQ
jgi:transposase